MGRICGSSGQVCGGGIIFGIRRSRDVIVGFMVLGVNIDCVGVCAMGWKVY